MIVKRFILIVTLLTFAFGSHEQCNTNVSICTPGTAGPFNFIPSSGAVSTCLDFWNGTAAPNYVYIILHITASGPLNMLIDANTNSGFLDVAVFNIPAGVAPCTAIQNSANQIGCNYASAASGCNQFGTYFPCTSSVPAPNVTAGQELMIVVEDWSNLQTNITLDLGPPPGAQTGPPNPAITPVGPFCTTSAPVQLTAVDMGGTWSGPGTSASGTFNPATAGIGTFTINYSVGVAPCNSASSTTITVAPAPVAGTASSTVTTFCGTTNVPLTLTGSSGTVQWQSGPTSTGPWTNITGGTGTSYTVTGVNTSRCFRAVVSGCGTPVNSNVICVTANPIPTINAGADVAVCAGNSTTLTASGGTTYSWSPSTYLNTSTGASVISTPAATITYTVTGTTAGCTNTDQVTVTYNALPTVNAGIDQSVCIGGAVTLSGSGANTYSWNNSVTNGTAFNPTVTATYTVTGTSTAGCINTDQAVVTVNPLPSVNAGPDVSICSGASTTLTASGAGSYSWSPGGQTTAAITVSPAATTTYTVTGTSLGCTATDAVTVTILGNAPINAGPDVTICANGSSMLSASGGSTYTWDNGLGVGNNVSVSPTTTTTYSVVGTTASGCTGSDAITIYVNALPTVNAGLDQTICAGTAVTLTGTGATSYSWTAPVSNGVAFTPAATATYTVTGTTSGCTSTDQVTITVNPIPTVGAGPDQAVCAGTAVTLSGTGASTYSWSPVITNGVAFTPASTTTYTVTGTTSGCTNTDQVTVTVNPMPTVSAGIDQTVCSGTQVTLSGSGASTYTWTSPVTNGVAFTPTLGSTTYTVTGTTAAGCTGTDQMVVTVNANPTPVINGPLTYCSGNYSTLSTSTAYSGYNWSTGVSTPTTNATNVNNPITVTVTNSFGCQGTSPAFNVTENSVITANFNVTICQGQTAMIHGVSQSTAGTYSQTYTTASGCDSTSNVTLVVNPLPNVNAGVDQSVCTGTATTLNATGASTYSWSPAATNGVPFTQGIGSTTYTVTGTSAQGCINSDQVIITVNALPTVGAGLDQAVCAGTAVTLNGSGANTYSWSGSVTNGTPFTPAATNTYTVTGTNTNGCINTDQVVVTINPIPTVGAGTDQTICIGASVTLSGSGASTYTWNNSVSNGVAFAPVSTLTYTVTGTSAQNCTNTDQVTVTVNPLPTVSAGVDQTVCTGTAITLSGSGATTYSWSPVVTNGVAFTPSVGTVTYTVTGTSSANCTNTDQMVVTVNPLPTVNAGIDQAVCAGTQVTLTGSGASTYSWNNGVTDGTAFTPVSTATYTLTGTSAAGCVNTDQVLVTVNPIPTVFGGNDVTVCDGQNATLTGSGANTYTWDNGVINGIAFQPGTGTTVYTVTGTTTAGCENTDQVNVTASPIPVSSFTVDTTYGCSPLTVNFTNTTPNSSNCVWSMSDGTVITGCGTVSNIFETPGCYDITLTTTSMNGCMNSFLATNLICVEGPPEAAFSPSESVINEFDTEIEFINNTNGATSYIWDFGDNSTSSFEVDPVHDYIGSDIGNYVVTLIAFSPFGCSDTTQSTIQIQEEVIFYVPNTFTPDFDNYNQSFKPIFTSGFDPFDYSLFIYNRWGEVIFESHNSEIGWDGSYGNQRQTEMIQDGVYNWKIEFKTTSTDERKMVVGHVNILR